MKKLLALLLVLCTLLSCMMLAVYADEEPAAEDPATEDPATEDPFAHETYTFVVFKESEEPFLVAPSPNKNDALRFSDGTTETIYCYTLKNIYSIESLNWHAKTSQQLLLQVTQNYQAEKTEWIDVYRYEWDDSQGDSQGIPAEERDYEMKDYFDPALGNKLYIRIADTNEANGWGGCIYTNVDTVLDLMYTPLSAEELDAYETASTADSLSIHGMNSGFGGFEFDTENQVAGSACASKATGTGFVNQQTFDPIDATGFDTVEFDWYISDIALLDRFQGEGMNTGFELTSSGKCDAEEISWNFAQIKEHNVNGELKAGWNHVVLYIAEAATAGEINLGAVNFCRIFMVGEPEDTGFTVKYDNIRFTKKYAAAVEAAKTEAQTYIDKIQAAIDAAKDGITGDNEKAVTNAYNSAKRAYDNLDAGLVKDQIPGSLISDLNKVKKALDDFKKASEETAAPAEETQGETQASGEETKDPGSDDKGSNTGLIIAIAAVAVVIIAVVIFLLAKKKK